MLCFPGAGQFRIGSDRIDGFRRPRKSDRLKSASSDPSSPIGWSGRDCPPCTPPRWPWRARPWDSSPAREAARRASPRPWCAPAIPCSPTTFCPWRRGRDRSSPGPAIRRCGCGRTRPRWFAERWQELPRVHPEADKRWVPIGSMGGAGFGDFLDATLPPRLPLSPRAPETAGPVEVQPDLAPRRPHRVGPPLLRAAAGGGRRSAAVPLRLLARLVRSVPVRRLVYPSGFERLQKVVEILLLIPASVNAGPTAPPLAREPHAARPTKGEE